MGASSQGSNFRQGVATTTSLPFSFGRDRSEALYRPEQPESTGCAPNGYFFLAADFFFVAGFRTAAFFAAEDFNAAFAATFD
jgi:hypothetical protein